MGAPSGQLPRRQPPPASCPRPHGTLGLGGRCPAFLVLAAGFALGEGGPGTRLLPQGGGGLLGAPGLWGLLRPSCLQLHLGENLLGLCPRIQHSVLCSCCYFASTVVLRVFCVTVTCGHCWDQRHPFLWAEQLLLRAPGGCRWRKAGHRLGGDGAMGAEGGWVFVILTSRVLVGASVPCNMLAATFQNRLGDKRCCALCHCLVRMGWTVMELAPGAGLVSWSSQGRRRAWGVRPGQRW